MAFSLAQIILFYFLVECCCQPTITSYDINGQSIGTIDVNNYDPLASYYIIGDGPTNITFWQPFNADTGGGTVAAILIKHIQQFVNNLNNTISVKLYQADWSGVLSTPICGPAPQECPDILMMGTTQVAKRVNEGTIMDLSSLILSYTSKTGIVLPSDFLTFTFFDYFIDGSWYAVPFVSDLRILAWNKATFDQLGLKYPPPWGNWSQPWFQSWNWKTFVDYSKTISDSGKKPGFSFSGCNDEEQILSMMIGQNYGVRLTENGKCGLNINDKFETAMTETIKKIFVDDKSGSPFTVPITDEFIAWVNEQNSDPLTEPTFCCKCGINQFSGMTINTPAAFSGYSIWNPRTNPTGTIGFGMIPGQLSFLGGSGLLITQNSRNPVLAWELILSLVNSADQNSALNELAAYTNNLPPFNSALQLDRWNTPEWEVAKLQITKSVPSQYPLQTFPQIGIFDEYVPFRTMWLNMIWKNMSVSESISRACEVIDYILQPPCTENEMDFTVSDCDNLGHRSLNFFWKPMRNCHGGVNLSEPLVISTCPYIPWNSPIGIALSVICVLMVLFASVLGISFLILRKQKIIILANVPFSLVVVFGAILAYGSVLTAIGNTQTTCVLPTWFLSLGFVLIFASFDLKMYRLWRIFNSNILVPVVITDQDLSLRFIVVLLIDVGLLLIWTFVPPSVLSFPSRFVSYGDVGFTEFYCERGNTTAIAILLIYKGIIFAAGCYFSFDLRNAPSDFKDREFLTVTISVLGVAAVVLVPASFLMDNRTTNFLLVSLGTIITTSFSLGMYAIPKILHGVGFLQLGEEMENFLNRKNVGAKCPTCKKPLTKTSHTATGTLEDKRGSRGSHGSHGSYLS